MRRACIDIGSNTTRLLVADCDGPRLEEVHQERSFTRIGRALRHDGRIPSDKLAEVAMVVADQLASARHLGAGEIRCVATASVRRAVNGAELVDRIAVACPGLAVEVLSGEEEARLAFVGAARTLEHGLSGPLGVVDVGGGSSEIVVGMPPDRVVWWASFPLGSGDIADGSLHSDPPAPSELDAASERVDEVLAGVSPPHAEAAVAVGGSATSLLRLVGPVLDTTALDRSLTLLARSPAADVAARYGLDPERVRLLPAGLLILRAVSALFAAPLRVGRGGIREGVLLDRS